MKRDIYSKSITVRKEHLDALRHVNNLVYLQWAQEISGEHWMSKSTIELNKAFYWVILEHHVHYKGQAYLGDVMEARTFVEKNTGVRSVRIVAFYKNDKLLVHIKTTWCLIDRKSGKPARVPKEVDEMFLYRS